MRWPTHVFGIFLLLGGAIAAPAPSFRGAAGVTTATNSSDIAKDLAGLLANISDADPGKVLQSSAGASSPGAILAAASGGSASPWTLLETAFPGKTLEDFRRLCDGQDQAAREKCYSQEFAAADVRPGVANVDTKRDALNMTREDYKKGLALAEAWFPGETANILAQDWPLIVELNMRSLIPSEDDPLPAVSSLPMPLSSPLPASVAWMATQARQCVGPSTRACLERGGVDNDCCARPGEGSCAPDYLFSTGPDCSWWNDAVATCCTPKPELCERSGACLEDGSPDSDCCALPGEGDCAAGYLYHEGEQCHSNGAVATCCKPLCALDRVRVCKENGIVDPDCCAKPGQGDCDDKFNFEAREDEVCDERTGAVKTCCSGSKDLATMSCIQLAVDAVTGFIFLSLEFLGVQQFMNTQEAAGVLVAAFTEDPTVMLGIASFLVDAPDDLGKAGQVWGIIEHVYNTGIMTNFLGALFNNSGWNWLWIILRIAATLISWIATGGVALLEWLVALAKAGPKLVGVIRTGIEWWDQCR